MKGFFDKRDVVVPLKERRDAEPSFESSTTIQFAAMQLQLEKVLYRVQQLERREKTMKNQVIWLRAEVSRLRKEIALPSAQPSTKMLPAAHMLPASSPMTVARPAEPAAPLSEPDFSVAADELNRERH